MTTFGVDINRHLQHSTTDEENIPHIISSCIDEIDNRGMKSIWISLLYCIWTLGYLMLTCSLLCNEMCPHHFPAPSLPLQLVMRMTKERKGMGWVRPMNLFPSYLPFISLSAPGSPQSYWSKMALARKNGFVILFLVQSNSKQNILWMKLRVGSNNLNNLLDFDRSFTCFFFSSFCRSWCQG